VNIPLSEKASALNGPRNKSNAVARRRLFKGRQYEVPWKWRRLFALAVKFSFGGNGGSAAGAQHLAAEFAGRYLKEGRALPVLALHANTSVLTAIGNDIDLTLFLRARWKR
jgi:hypothetical protein